MPQLVALSMFKMTCHDRGSSTCGRVWQPASSAMALYGLVSRERTCTAHGHHHRVVAPQQSKLPWTTTTRAEIHAVMGGVGG
jgi:hypothetical protein